MDASCRRDCCKSARSMVDPRGRPSPYAVTVRLSRDPVHTPRAVGLALGSHPWGGGVTPLQNRRWYLAASGVVARSRDGRRACSQKIMQWTWQLEGDKLCEERSQRWHLRLTSRSCCACCCERRLETAPPLGASLVFQRKNTQKGSFYKLQQIINDSSWQCCRPRRFFCTPDCPTLRQFQFGAA